MRGGGGGGRGGGGGGRGGGMPHGGHGGHGSHGGYGHGFRGHGHGLGYGYGGPFYVNDVVESLPENLWVVVSPNGLLLRAAPSTSAPILTLMPNGARVTGEPVGHGWFAVSYGGMSGFAMGAYLRSSGTVEITHPHLRSRGLPR